MGWLGEYDLIYALYFKILIRYFTSVFHIFYWFLAISLYYIYYYSSFSYYLARFSNIIQHTLYFHCNFIPQPLNLLTLCRPNKIFCALWLFGPRVAHSVATLRRLLTWPNMRWEIYRLMHLCEMPWQAWQHSKEYVRLTRLIFRALHVSLNDG